MAGGLRFSRPYLLALFALVLLSWTSGIGFFILDTWGEVEGEFGPQKHPWQFSVLKIHAAGAFLMMITFGALLSRHVPAGWRVRDLRALGLAVTLAVGSLVVSAYLLYYVGDDGIRRWTAWIHAGIGFTLPFLLSLHFLQGRRRRRRRRATTGRSS